MQVNKITGYNVFITEKTYGVSIHLHEGERVKLISPDPRVTMLRLDVLRHEDPVFYNRKSGMLYTGEEEVGEGE